MNHSQKEILDAVDIISKGYYDKTTQVYTGVLAQYIPPDITQSSYFTVDNIHFGVSINNRTYLIFCSGKSKPTEGNIGEIVKVFVPKNNFQNAFFLYTQTSGETGVTSYVDLTDLPLINGVTIAGSKSGLSYGLYDASNPPPYPVTSVDGNTGAVVLNDVKYISQTLTTAQQNQARTNIGAGTSSFSGSYTDLTNKPTIPTTTSQLTNDSGFITSSQSPVQSVNGKTGSVVLTQDDVGSGSTYVQTENNFTDADVTKLSGIATGAQVNVIESVQKNGTALTITNKAVNVTVPTKTSDITNDSGYITSAQAPVQSVNGYTGAVTLTKSDVGLSNVANVLQYSTSNPPPYPVTSVNTQTGEVSLTTDNVPATTTNRYVPAVPTSNPDTSYLNGNGVFSALAVGGASSVADVFFSNTASTVSGYKTLNYVADTTATELSVTMTSAADVLSATYLYSAPLGVTVIDSGVWDSSFYMKCSTASTGVNRLKMVVFVRHANGTETDLFTKYSSSVNLTVYDSYYTQTNHPSFAVLATDTLGVRLYGNTTRNSSTTITYTIGGTNASFFNTPLALRHSQLRDLNGDSNYQHITSAQVTQIGTNTTNISNLTTTVNNHISNTNNPHTVTKAQVGLSNVANVLQYSASNPPPYPVASVNSKTGAVVLSASDVGALPSTTTYVSSVNGNSGAVTITVPTKTSDLTNDSGFLVTTLTSPTNGQIIAYNGTSWINQDPQASAQLQANWTETSTASVQYIQNKPDLSIYAPLASPALTGTPTAPTAAVRTNTTQLATTEFVLANSAEIILSSTQPTSQISGDFWYQIL